VTGGFDCGQFEKEFVFANFVLNIQQFAPLDNLWSSSDKMLYQAKQYRGPFGLHSEDSGLRIGAIRRHVLHDDALRRARR
jgi:hypothetical protein